MASAVSTDIVKDVYRFEERESILAIFQSMVISFTSWRGVFLALAAIGFIALMGSTAFQDMVARRINVTIVHRPPRSGAQEPWIFIITYPVFNEEHIGQLLFCLECHGPTVWLDAV